MRAADRTRAFAAYNIAGSLMGGLGALSAALPDALGLEAPASYRALMWAYAAAGLLLIFLFWQLSERVEAPAVRAGSAEQVKRKRGLLGFFALEKSRDPVAKLAALFALDNFASGFVVQGIVSYWFHERYGVQLKELGAIAFGTNLFAVASFIAAPFDARRLGLLKTMVFTHLIGNALLMLVPLAPGAGLAITAWLARYLFAQMDIPPKQSYTMAIVDENERAAASGVFSVSRNVAASVAPSFSGLTMSAGAIGLGLPFFIAGGLKMLYDVALYAVFKDVKPPEEVVEKKIASPFAPLREAA